MILYMERSSIETRSIGTRPTAVVRADLTPAELGDWLHRVFNEVDGYLHSSGNHPAGPPFARYRPLDDGRLDVEAGFGVSSPIEGSGEIEASSLPAGTVAVVTHTGCYDEIGATYEVLSSWLSARELTAAGDPWEVYFSDPEEPPSAWRTDIYQPCERVPSRV